MPVPYRIEVTRSAREDLREIFRYLRDTYVGFGEDWDSAGRRARERIVDIRRDMMSISNVPHQGTLSTRSGTGIRHVTKKRAILYFVVDDDKEIVEVIAIFYGGQDHLAHMRKRFP